ncbi:MAG: hypothetical protein REI78_16330 [Pedobacter sp.]|nr:hypothetical protein [Pedobacter sp.]MDQ8054598.1 hypothetical protein [Pedobacter sp.]
MKKTILYLTWLLAFTAFAPVAQAQNNERIQASYLLAFGRLPNSGELSYWNGQGQKSVQQLIDNHKSYIKGNMGTVGKDVIIKSYVDALGYRPSQAEINYHTQFGRTYAEMMNNHLIYVKGQPAEYEKVIKRSYQTVLGRQPNAGELAYWKGQGTFSYMVLVNCHQDWKNRNAQGQSQATNISTSAPLLATASVSSGVLNESKTAYNSLVSPGGGSIIAAGGGNVIAPGGANVIAPGGANIIAAGGGNIIAAGGGN